MTSSTSRTRREPPKSGTVTRVSPQQSTAERMNVYLDEAYAFSMSVRSLTEHPISVGDTLSEADVRRLLAADEPDRATNSSLNLLSHRGRSERELRQRLRRKGYTSTAIDEAVRRVIDWGYLNDERFAEGWVEQRQASRPRSRRALAHELREKGVDRQIIETTLGEAEIDEVGDARRLASDKWRKERGQPPDKRRQRTAAFLARRGYGWDVAKRVLDELAGEKGGDVTGNDFP
ncbi:MAG TPA: regulatory protein RecX [Thermomicrobiales bacterium]|nr:regulatory protein RecX [Thermomicrobiales bacterium]